MQKKERRYMKKRVETYRYLICFIVLAALCWLFPYTGDDWAWGSSIGIDRLNTWFENYSGRYAGNLIVLVLTRSNILKTLTMAFCLTGIIYCIERLIREKWAFYLSCLLLVFLPRAVFRQAVVWTAGFSNYVTSIFLTLIYIVYIYRIFEEEEQERRLKQEFLPCIPLFVLGVVNTLIVEHLTLYNVALGFFVLLFVFVKYRKIYVQHVFYFAGAVCGTCYMFSNSVYHSIQASEDGYRSVAQGGIVKQALNSYFNVIYEELYMNNLWLNLILLAVCILLYKKIKGKMENEMQQKTMQVCLGIMLCYAMYALFSVVGLGEAAKQQALMYLEGIGTIVCAVSVILFGIMVGLQCGRFWKILFVMGSIVCIAAPLFVVNPIGSRCFFATYVMFIVLVCELCKIWQQQGEAEFPKETLKRAGVMVSAVGIIFYLCIFAGVYRVDRARLSHIRTQAAKGETEIEILHLPYEAYIWAPTPNTGEIWEERYKLFYDLPEDIKLKAVWKYSR